MEKLNNELLKEPEPEKEKTVKRNSKDELVKKIVELSKNNDVKLEHSDTKLRRMTKQQLNELLASVVEKIMRDEMCRQVKCKPGAADSVIALGALRMVHDLCAKGTEKCINIFLPPYGYELDGFADSLKDPSVREATDACLAEIAKDSDFMQYIESPWARLGIAWAGALVTSVRPHRKRYSLRENYYASRMESRQLELENPRRERGDGRRAENGEEQRDSGPTLEKCLTV